jgi:hypothetical protein
MEIKQKVFFMYENEIFQGNIVKITTSTSLLNACNNVKFDDLTDISISKTYKVKFWDEGDSCILEFDNKSIFKNIDDLLENLKKKFKEK